MLAFKYLRNVSRTSRLKGLLGDRVGILPFKVPFQHKIVIFQKEIKNLHKTKSSNKILKVPPKVHLRLVSIGFEHWKNR